MEAQKRAKNEVLHKRLPLKTLHESIALVIVSLDQLGLLGNEVSWGC